MDVRSITCLRCNVQMAYTGTEKIQLGEPGALFERLSNIIAGSLKVDVYMCPQCGKIEFFDADFAYRAEEDGFDEDVDMLPQNVCPECGTSHDIDYPRCPNCGYSYVNE